MFKVQSILEELSKEIYSNLKMSKNSYMMIMKSMLEKPINSSLMVQENKKIKKSKKIILIIPIITILKVFYLLFYLRFD